MNETYHKYKERKNEHYVCACAYAIIENVK